MAWLKCIHTNYKTALVKSLRTGRSFPVKVVEDIQGLVCVGDKLQVIRSPVSGEWLAVDYIRNIDTVGGLE